MTKAQNILVGYLSLLVAACSPLTNDIAPMRVTPSATIAAITSTATPIPSLTPSPTPTSTPHPTQTPTVEPSSTPTPKPILISYSTGGGDGADEIFTCLRWRGVYSFVLYEDGQLIRYTENGLVETILSETDIDNLLKLIENTGFFQVEGTGRLGQNDPIYKTPKSFQAGDGSPSDWFTVKGKMVIVSGDLSKYVIEPVRQTMEIIRDFPLTDINPYTPENLGLWVFGARGDEEFSYATPIPPIAEWPSGLPKLEFIATTSSPHPLWGSALSYMVLDKVDTESANSLFGQFPSGRLFTQAGETYYVIACPALP